MSDNNEVMDYDDDSRVPCRYGLNCYQKNTAHHEKYKHPPKNQMEAVQNQTEPCTLDKNYRDKCSSEKPKKKNLLTDWLKSPPNKKTKVEESIKAKLGTGPSTSKDKSPCREIKNNKFDKNVKLKGEIKPKIEIVLNSFEDTVNCMKKVNNKNSNENKELKNTSSVSEVPLLIDAKSKIKHFFLVDMPDDFYQFWEFCESIGTTLLVKGNPLDAFKNVGLTLVGPFEVLANKFKDNISYDRSTLLRHYRYYYDVPEFQTVIKGDDKSGYHLGYFRDDPKEKPVFVASNCAAENGIIKSLAENLFGAVNIYLEEYKKSADPFAKLKIIKLQNLLTAWANKENITLSKSTAAMKQREAKVVTRTFHKAGLVVPYNKKTEQGYRELAENDAMIKGMLMNIVNSRDEEERKTFFSKLYPVINYANIANDECDFGTSLELGLDFFTFGSPLLHETIKRLTTTAYKLLGRDEFAEIIEAHMQDRKSGTNLSILKKS